MLSDDLLELQRLDTALTQARRRREQLPERAAHDEARTAVADAAARRGQADAQRQALEARIDAAEQQAHEIDEHRTRLQAQLKTVIAPREAEALMHELDTLKQRRDALDDDELAALDEEGEIDTTLAEIAAGDADRAAAVETTSAALARAETDLDAETAEFDRQRAEVAGRIDAGQLARYDSMRAQFGGVAVAHLDGRRCTGCHLDLSVSELDEARSAAPITECPQCGRMLVIA